MAGSMREAFDLSGKVAIVTGASKGIGESMSRALAEFGARVVVSSRKLEAVESVAEQINGAGGQAFAFAAHAGSTSDLHALVDAAVERFGGVDIVVNNAAANPVFGPIVNTDEAVFDKIMAVNVKGPLELAKRAFPIMAERGGGSVINISSIGGLKPEPMLGIYSVSKAALISLTKVLAAEWGAAGVRVNAVCPGLVQTKFSAALWQAEDNLQRFLRQVPLGRIAQPDEIGPLAVFLGSAAGAYCTGAVFVIDGGYLA